MEGGTFFLGEDSILMVVSSTLFPSGVVKDGNVTLTSWGTCVSAKSLALFSWVMVTALASHSANGSLLILFVLMCWSTTLFRIVCMCWKTSQFEKHLYCACFDDAGCTFFDWPTAAASCLSFLQSFSIGMPSMVSTGRVKLFLPSIPPVSTSIG